MATDKNLPPLEFRVTLHTANGHVTTSYREEEDAIRLIRQYVYQRKPFSFVVERA